MIFYANLKYDTSSNGHRSSINFGETLAPIPLVFVFSSTIIFMLGQNPRALVLVNNDRFDYESRSKQSKPRHEYVGSNEAS
mmetsp:Transcript_25979/g.53741  ORF Transcript_25979/g.53741 Transcript_25979/m.53741 type:complete len:81 (+) Transcript_25979:101-343(+)